MATQREKQKPRRKPAVLKGIKAKGTTADVPVPIDTVLGIMNRMTTALQAVEKRLAVPEAIPGGTDGHSAALAETLSRPNVASSPSSIGGANAPDVPSVASLAEGLCLRTNALCKRTEELVGRLVYGANPPGEPVGNAAARKSEGPTKDALINAHANLSYVEDLLDRAAVYLLA